MAIPLRTISRFEHQLLAMNRLRSEGEPALALVGTLSLAEWYANSRIGVEKDEWQPSLSKILEGNRLSFLQPTVKDALLRSIKIRNRLVHGSPPRRQDISQANQTGSGSEDEGMDTDHSAIVEEAIHAVFELYRQINVHLAQAQGACQLHGESGESAEPDR